MPSLGPASGRAPTSVVVMLHGYGANGADLRDVALTLAQSLPDTVFLLPDGLEALPGSPEGRQWFPLAGSDDAQRLAGVRRAVARLTPWIDRELRTRSLARPRLGLVGFSQGAMLALDLGLHLDPAPAGVVSLSGRLVDGANPSPAPAPALIVHGTADRRIPVASAGEALARLGQLHVRAESLIMPGVGHTITPAGMATAAAFLRRLWP
jgi:phospholipase/carboxylesterase